MASFIMNDRVELKEDLGNHVPALKKGRRGKIVDFPNGKKEAERFCFVKFDGYTRGVVSAPFSKLKKI